MLIQSSKIYIANIVVAPRKGLEDYAHIKNDSSKGRLSSAQ